MYEYTNNCRIEYEYNYGINKKRKNGDYHLKTHLLHDLFIETNLRNHISNHVICYDMAIMLSILMTKFRYFGKTFGRANWYEILDIHKETYHVGQTLYKNFRVISWKSNLQEISTNQLFSKQTSIFAVLC